MPGVSTRTQRPRRVLTSIALSTILVGGLASCSSEASIDEFCEENVALNDAPVDEGAGPEAQIANVRSVIERANEIEAPEEIKDDWETTITGFEEYLAVIEDVDLADAEAMNAASEEGLAVLGDQEFLDASQRVDTFVTENCTE